MSEQLLTVVRICMLALVYLTFFCVLRAVWAEIRAESRVVVGSPVAGRTRIPEPAVVAAGAGPGRAPGPGASRLIVRSPPALAGMVFDLEEENTLGRAPGCGVVIDDQRVSNLHARVFMSGGRWAIEDLGSTNGTLLNDCLLDRSCMVGPGDRIQIGEHLLELM